MGHLPPFQDIRPDTSRRMIALGLVGAAVAPRAEAAPCAPPRVLFVCPAGTVKSAIAREMLRQRAAASGVRVEVRSRGLRPEDHISPSLAANLAADRIDPMSEPALTLIDADVARADIVVAFDDAAQAPALKGARSWRTPSWNAAYPAAKIDLVVRLDALLAELREREAHGCSGAGR